MDHIFEEIEKIQGERQADQRIQKVLLELTNVVHNIMINVFPSICCDDCNEGESESDDLRAELTELAEKNEALEEENDDLRAIATDLSEDEKEDVEDETKSDS